MEDERALHVCWHGYTHSRRTWNKETRSVIDALRNHYTALIVLGVPIKIDVMFKINKCNVAAAPEILATRDIILSYFFGIAKTTII